MTLVSLDVLFMILFLCWVALSRKLSILERAEQADAERERNYTEDVRTELNRIETRLDMLEMPDEDKDAAEEELRKARAEEKRYTEGLANILSYEFTSAGKRGNKI